MAGRAVAVPGGVYFCLSGTQLARVSMDRLGFLLARNFIRTHIVSVCAPAVRTGVCPLF